MKTLEQFVCAAAMAVLLVSCGKSGSSSQTQVPDPATQPEAQATLFQRSTDRAKALIAAKEYKQAQATLDLLKTYKLTPEQQKVADELQAQTPKSN